MSLSGSTASLLKQLEKVGAAELDAAVSEALRTGATHLAGVHQVLERRRHERNEPPPVGHHLPRDKRVQGYVVRPHALSDYDHIGRNHDDTEEEAD